MNLATQRRGTILRYSRADPLARQQSNKVVKAKKEARVERAERARELAEYEYSYEPDPEDFGAEAEEPPPPSAFELDDTPVVEPQVILGIPVVKRRRPRRRTVLRKRKRKDEKTEEEPQEPKEAKPPAQAPAEEKQERSTMEQLLEWLPFIRS